MVEDKHFSTSTVTREIRQREVVAKAKGVLKLLLKLGLISGYFEGQTFEHKSLSSVPDTVTQRKIVTKKENK